MLLVSHCDLWMQAVHLLEWLCGHFDSSNCKTMAAAQPERPVVRPRSGLAAGISLRRNECLAAPAAPPSALGSSWRTQACVLQAHFDRASHGTRDPRLGAGAGFDKVPAPAPPCDAVALPLPAIMGYITPEPERQVGIRGWFVRLSPFHRDMPAICAAVRMQFCTGHVC